LWTNWHRRHRHLSAGQRLTPVGRLVCSKTAVRRVGRAGHVASRQLTTPSHHPEAAAPRAPPPPRRPWCRAASGRTRRASLALRTLSEKVERVCTNLGKRRHHLRVESGHSNEPHFVHARSLSFSDGRFRGNDTV
jgi:hypothetical protein